MPAIPSKKAITTMVSSSRYFVLHLKISEAPSRKVLSGVKKHYVIISDE